MVAVPADTPNTEPAELTDATDEALVLQVPPVALLVRVPVEPIHTVEGPEIEPAAGAGLTVTVVVALVAPHELTTV